MIGKMHIRIRPLVFTVLLTSLFVLSMFAVLPLGVNAQSGLTLTVNSVNSDTSGPIYGFYVVLHQNGHIVSTGSTTAYFSVNSGENYSIQAYNNASCTFRNWLVPVYGGGNTNYSNPMTFTAVSNSGPGEMSIQATYSCQPSSGTSNLTVASQNTNQQVISGYYTILYGSSSNVVGTGFTPATFTLNNGASYSVQVDNYGSCHFVNWLDGSTANPRAVSIMSNTHLTAVYNCGTGGPSSVTINSVNQNGNTINGYYTILRTSGGSTVATGFTPKTFSTTSGQSYTIQADSYGSCIFFHWSNGATSDPMAFTATSSAQTFTAVYNCGSRSSSSVTVNSVNQNGNAISGYYVVLYNSGGGAMGTGFTPKTFSTTSGQSYSVRADSYGSCTFAHWSNGVTSDPMPFTATSSAQTFTAVYNCG